VFEQVNPEMGDRVRAHAIGQLGGIEGVHVWDLYAGVGEATARLAELGATVESVELDVGAVAFAEQRGPAAGVRRHAGRVEAWLGRLSRPAAVFCNPPRAGLEAVVVDGLLAAAPRTVVYVSCDPATLARDLGRFGRGGYRVGPVTAFDLFPQTAHVETVVRLERP
jgi:23S rRNA (uracil1939-C5)-methyltransferase